jgi:hypothetical protein
MQNRQQKCSLVGLQWYGLDLDRAAGSPRIVSAGHHHFQAALQ